MRAKRRGMSSDEMSLETVIKQAYALPFALILIAINWTTAAQEISALRDHNTDQPIDITADELEVRQKDNLAIFKGQVVVTQGDLRFLSETLTVYYVLREGATTPTISRLDAAGNVQLTSPSESVQGDWGVYDVDQRIVTLGGAVILERGDTTIVGDRLELDLQSGITRFANPSADEGETAEGRVRGRFAVPEDDEPEDESG